MDGGEDLPMPWKETCVMDERMRFVVAALEGERPMSELCRQAGIPPLPACGERSTCERSGASRVRGLARESERGEAHHPPGPGAAPPLPAQPRTPAKTAPPEK